MKRGGEGMKGGGGEGMKAATNEGRESSVRVVLARGHVTSLVRAGFFSLVIFRRFFYRWLIYVDFFFVACLGRDRWLRP